MEYAYDIGDVRENLGPYPRGPLSFAISVVAKIAGHYRQLANVRYELPLESPRTFLRGGDAVRLCLRVIGVFSHPSNRIAIDGELSLAADAYTRGGLSPVPRYLDKNVLHRRSYAGSSEPWPPAPWLREFPFIALALELAASYDSITHKFDTSMKAEHLGLAYCNDDIKFAVCIIDITNVDNIGYGIVAAGHKEAHFQRIIIFQHLEEKYDYIVEPRSRSPLSAKKYMDRFGYKPKDQLDIQALDHLEMTSLIPPEGLQGQSDIQK